MITMSRIAVMIALWALATPFATVATAQTRAQTPVQINIKAQPMSDALNDFAAQTGLQLLFRVEKVMPAELNAPAVAGKMTPGEVLDRLLKGTELHWVFVNDRTVEVRAKAKPAEPAARTTRSGVETARERGSEDPRSYESQDLPAPEETGKAIPEVLVIGSTSLNADIERTENSAQPYVVFGQAEIERSHTPNLEEFLKTRLPMNTTQSTVSQSSGFGSNQSSINLRGLGANQTLILVDGRRMPRISNNGSFQQADINGIPLSAIARIEVLPSTASGIYGGDATGGVINIILRRDYSGAELKLGYGNTFDSDVATRNVDFSAGFALEGGATRVMLAASYADVNPLLTGERDFTAQARALQFNNAPATLTNDLIPPVGATSNICSADSFGFGICSRIASSFGIGEEIPLTLRDGTALGSSITFVPVGYAGTQSDDGVALVANAGNYNIGVPNNAFGTQSSLLNDPTVRSGLLNVRRDFGSRIEGFVDFSWLDNRGHTFNAGVPSSTLLPATAPNNPFATDIVVSFPATGLLDRVRTESETVRAAAGAIVRLPRDWSVVLEYAWSRSRLSNFSSRNLVGDPDGTAGPAVPVEAALADGTLDVVRDLNTFPLDWTPYLLPTPNQITGPADTVLQDATIRLSGPLLQLPAGPLLLSSSIEHRKEEAREAVLRLLDIDFAILAPERGQTVDSYYMELNAPLVAPQSAVPSVRSLDLLASVRHDEYETTSTNPSTVTGSLAGPFPDFERVTNRIDATKYTLALRYSPIEDLALRASRGTGFLPPSVHQLQLQFTPSSFVNVFDPRRGNVQTFIGPVAQTSGGNPDLDAEDSESWSVGAVYMPRFVPDLRVSLDYTRIRKTNEITVLNAQDLLNLEGLFPGRVTRDPLTPADEALGFTGGVITAFDTTLVNAAVTRLEAYDLQLDYTLETGRVGELHFYTVATLQPSFERRLLPNAPNTDSVGFIDGQLEWRGNVGIVWNRGPLTLAWNTQYFDSYLVYGAASSPEAIDAATQAQGSARIPSQTYSDLSASWRFEGDGLLANSEISLGMQNLFDESPPILATIGPNGGYSFYGDPRLRRYFLSLRKNFSTSR